MPKRKRHHVVSRGYLRFFADGELLQLIDKESHTYKTAGTRTVFVRLHFNSWRNQGSWDASLEDEWGDKVERHVLPRVRALIEGARGLEEREAAKVLAALHFARSYAYEDAHRRIAEMVMARVGPDMAADPAAVAAYVEKTGRTPGPGDIEATVTAAMEQIQDDRTFFVQGMVRAYKGALKLFEPLSVQLLVARGPVGFVTSDTPFVYTDKMARRFGLRDRLALGDAELNFMALGSRLGMQLVSAKAPPDDRLNANQVKELNNTMWRASERYLVCHPAMVPFRLLNRPLRRIEPRR